MEKGSTCDSKDSGSGGNSVFDPSLAKPASALYLGTGGSGYNYAIQFLVTVPVPGAASGITKNIPTELLMRKSYIMQIKLASDTPALSFGPM